MYEINASMLVLSDYFFELQDMSRAQVILRGFWKDNLKNIAADRTVHFPIRGNE